MTSSIYPEGPGALGRSQEERAEALTWRAWLDVDLDAVRRNAERLRDAAGAPLIAMVKANAYGLGVVPVASTLGATFEHGAALATDVSSVAKQDDLLWGLGVAALDEARSLRFHGCTSRILLTSPTLPQEHAEAIALDVRVALHRREDIRAWRAQGGGAWHLSIDTGMARGGARWDALAELREVVREAPPEGVFTHFHSADVEDGSRLEQERRFDDALSTLGDALAPDALVHTDNSAAIAARAAGGVRSPGNLARPGIGLYGANVLPGLPLEQTIALRARVIDLRDLQHGESVSYGATWRADGARRIATIGIGYGDGYRRAFSNHGRVLLRGRQVPVVGLVTMDMTMLDVTGVPCEIGDVVTLVGEDGVGTSMTNSTDAVAASGVLSPYELLTGLALRVPHRYVGGRA